jgi:hypothetical protein
LAILTPEKSFVSSPRWAFVAVAVAACAVMLGTCLQVWSPAYGLTRFIPIGREFEQRGIPVYRATPKYVPPTRWGFDGQLYAEMALDPLLRDPGIKTALDDPAYRADRILLPWLAWLGGLGHPFWILNVYAALNPLFWLAYGAILYRLFRPYSWAGVAGFAAMLLTCGVIESTFKSLTDFPAFVLMTLAAMIGGSVGAGVLGLAALAREINLIGLVGVLEFEEPWREALGRNLRRIAIAAVPLAFWFWYVRWRLPAEGGAHVLERIRSSMVGDNINWPLYAIGRKLEEVVAVIRQGGVDWPHFYKSTPLHALLTIVATLTQCLYLLTHREWKNRLWRVGLVFVPLFLCVAYQVWYSHFTVTRHALPITLAFNLLLAARPNRRWLIWFIMGNCFVPYGIYKFVCFGLETSHPAEFTVSAALPPGVDIDVSFGAGWTGVEWDSQRSWRWATGPRATLLLANGGRSTLEVELAGNVLGAAPHDLSVSTPGANLWQGRLEAQPVPLHTRKFTVPPGIIVVTFEIAPPEAEANARSFRISDLSAVVTPSR